MLNVIVGVMGGSGPEDRDLLAFDATMGNVTVSSVLKRYHTQ
jgi:hypothetical protein